MLHTPPSVLTYMQMITCLNGHNVFSCEKPLLQELHARHGMEGSLAWGILALLYADDLVDIAFTADGIQSDIIDPCVEYARKHRYQANVCGLLGTHLHRSCGC